MTNVLFTTKQTIVKSLTAVGATADAAASGINSLAALAQAGELHALAYRDSVAHQIETERRATELLSEQTAKINVATKLMAIHDQLKDPALKAIYDQISLDWSKPTKPTLMAAE